MGCFKEGKVWRYEFQHQGKRYTRSGFPTKKEALATREAHKKEVKKAKTTPVTVSEPTFHDVAYQYLDYSRNHFSEKNWKGKRFVYGQFHAQAKNPVFKDIDALMVEKYLETLLPRNANYNRHRKALCSLFAWAFHHQIVPVNPCIYIKLMGHIPAKKKIPSQDEMVRIIMAAGEQRTFFLALFSLAGRLGEINNLRWEDVNFERRQVSLWTRKGDGTPFEQIKSMNEELYAELKRLWDRHAGTWVFPNPETGEPYRNRRWQIKMACKRAGVPYYSWHCIRHHVASFLADTEKESLPTIQKMLGHRSPATTVKYVQSLGQDVVAAAAKLKTTQTTHTSESEDAVK